METKIKKSTISYHKKLEGTDLAVKDYDDQMSIKKEKELIKWCADFKSDFAVGIKEVRLVRKLKPSEFTLQSEDFGEGYYRGNFKGWRVRDNWGVLYINSTTLKKWKIIAGVPTFFPSKKIKEKALWFEKSRGYSGKLIEGFVIRGTHLAAKTLEDAQKKFARIEKRILSQVKTEGLKWVTIDDSLNGGNCDVGTKTFVRRFGLDNLGAVRSDWLIELGKRASMMQFVQRAINASTHRVAA